MASQLFTGLILQPLFQGAILSKSQINPDIQNGVIPAGQAKPNPDLEGTTESPFSTPSGIDDDLGVTTPAGIQRALHLTEETTTESPDGKFSKDRNRTIKVITKWDRFCPINLPDLGKSLNRPNLKARKESHKINWREHNR